MSLRLRLVLAVATVALVALVGVDVAVYAAYRSSLFGALDQRLDGATLPISRLVGGPLRDGALRAPSRTAETGAPPVAPSTGPDQSSALPTRLPRADFCVRVGLQLGSGSVIELRAPNGRIRAGSACLDGKPLTDVGPAISQSQISTAAGGTILHFTPSAPGTEAYRVAASPIADGDVLVVALPLEATEHDLSKLLVEEVITSASALVLAILLGLLLVRLGLRPLSAVEQTAEAITGGDLSQRVPGEERRTEVGALARAINSMLRRIQAAFAERDATELALRTSEGRLRRFVADASHELRTPIAAVSAYAELFATGAAEPEHGADLARVMSGIQGETKRMGALVEDLLLLARLDEGRPLERREVELVALCSDAARTAVAVAPEWPVHLEATEPVELFTDEARLRQVIDNLLANVRAHTPEATHAIVRVSGTDAVAVVTVEDDGPGFAPGDADRVFERFYRADPSRSRATGGSGLGLAIVASVVAALGGSVRAENAPNGGARVIVTLERGAA